MPIYEYQCDDCAETFDVFIRSAQTPSRPKCPQCGGEHVEKRVTAAAALGMGNAASAGASVGACAPSG